MLIYFTYPFNLIFVGMLAVGVLVYWVFIQLKEGDIESEMV